MWLVTSLMSPEYFAHYRNRNRYYLFLLVTLGACIAMQYILAAKAAVGEASWTRDYSYYGKKVYVKYIDGMMIHYTSTSNQPEVFGIVLEERTSRILEEYGEALLLVGMALCMFLLVKFLRSKRIWKDTECVHRKGIAYVAELLTVALLCFPIICREFGYILRYNDAWSVWNFDDWVALIEYAAEISWPLLGTLVYFFVCFWNLHSLF